MPNAGKRYEDGDNEGLIDLAEIDLRMSEHVDMTEK